MPRTKENAESSKNVRLPPKRGQIKVKIMNEIVRVVEEAGRAMCSKEKVADESQPHDSSSHG